MKYIIMKFVLSCSKDVFFGVYFVNEVKDFFLFMVYCIEKEVKIIIIFELYDIRIMFYYFFDIFDNIIFYCFEESLVEIGVFLLSGVEVRYFLVDIV